MKSLQTVCVHCEVLSVKLGIIFEKNFGQSPQIISCFSRSLGNEFTDRLESLLHSEKFVVSPMLSCCMGTQSWNGSLGLVQFY